MLDGAGARIRVAVAGGYPAIASGVRALLAEAADFDVVDGRPGVAAEALVVILEGAADGGTRAGRDFEGPLVLLAPGPRSYREGRTETGRPVAYLLHDSDGDELRAAVRAVAAGLTAFAPAVLASLGASERGSPPHEDGRPELTAREREVLEGVAAGLPNKAIARRLAISEHTVKFHVGVILGKLGAASRTEAVMTAARAGLLPL